MVEELTSFWTLLFSSIIAGGLAGCAVDFALFPVDALKTRLQRGPSAKVSFENMYAGLSASMAASFPAAATFWATYNIAKFFLEASGVDLAPPVKHILSAACGSVTTSLVRNPFEVVKQQMQVGQHKSAREAPFAIIKQQGIAGLWIGVGSLICREIPFDGIQFVIYEFLKSVDYGTASTTIGMFSHFLHGAIAGGTAAFVTTPIDVAKTRMMTQYNKEKIMYTSLPQTIGLIFRSEGLTALWQGWTVRVLFTTVGGVMFFGTFEFVSPLIS